jgi:lipopolysaccharide cholinephosphotransferase
MFDFKSPNTTTTLLLILLLLIIVIINFKDNIIFENFDNTEYEKFPKLTYIQDMEIKKLLKILHKVLAENKIDYSMCGGTLLGAIRHKNRIPWDDDADVFIFDKDQEKIKKIDWSKYGCKLHEHWIGYKLCFENGKSAVEMDQKQKWNFPFVDIFIVSKFGDRWTYKNERCRSYWPNDYLYEEELFPLKLYQFDDLMLYGPNNVYRYLTRYFGDGWETNVEMKTSHIAGKDLKTIKFTVCDYAKHNKSDPIKYLWVIYSSDFAEIQNKKEVKFTKEQLINTFNNKYILVFINMNNIKIYLPNSDIKFNDQNDIEKIKDELFKKHGGKFLIL